MADIALTHRQERTRPLIRPSRILLYLGLCIVAFVSILPLLWMVSTSWMTLGETMLKQPLPGAIRFENYVEAWEKARFALYFRNSIIIALLTIVGQIIVNSLAAYAFARMKFVGRDLLFTLYMATLMIPESVLLVPNFLMVSGNVLPFIRWIDKLPALTVPFMASAFTIFLLRQFFAQIPSELWDAARMDGAGHLRFLLQIVMPIARPALLTVGVLTFMGSWNALAWPILVTRTPTWRPISVGLWSFISEAGPSTHQMMAGAVIAVVPVLLLYFLLQRQFTEGIATTGLKG